MRHAPHLLLLPLTMTLVASSLLPITALGAEASVPSSGEEEEEKQPIQEVFQSELVYPQERRELQITVAPQVRRGAGNDRWISELTLEYGLTDALQVEAEWSVSKVLEPAGSSSSVGTGDLEIALKYSWMNVRDTAFHSALGVGFGIPTGNEERGFGEGEATLEPFVALALDLPRREDTQIFLHAGFEIEEEGGKGFVNSGVFAKAGIWIITAEINWSEGESYFSPGLVAHPRENWEIGVGTPIGLTAESDRFRLILMATYEFQLSGSPGRVGGRE